MLTLATLPAWAISLLIVGFLFICILLILTVLIQRPQGGGLAGAFGSSAGSGQTAFGAKTGDALTIFTIGMFVVYLLAAIGLNYVVRPASAAPEPAPAPQTTSTTPTNALPPANQSPGAPGAGPAGTPVPTIEGQTNVPPPHTPTAVPAPAQPAPTPAPVAPAAKPESKPAPQSGAPAPAPAAPARPAGN